MVPSTQPHAPANDAHETDELVDGLVDDIVELKREVAQLRGIVADHVVTAQATGMLMLAYGLDAERAAATLRHWSEDFGVTRRFVAERPVDASEVDVPRSELRLVRGRVAPR